MLQNSNQLANYHLQELQKFIKVPKTTFKFIKALILKASQFITPTKCMKAQRRHSTLLSYILNHQKWGKIKIKNCYFLFLVLNG